MTILIILALLFLSGLASALGRTADSRDPAYSMGRMLDSHRDANRPVA